MMTNLNLPRRLYWVFLSVLTGVLAGLAASVFLFALESVTEIREARHELIWGLPLAGLFIGGLYHLFGREVAAGHNLILDEIHDPKKILPLRMAPLVLVGTVMTHLFGGSAGREGTAVQMGSSLADQLSRFFRVENGERRLLLVAGAGAGFGAAIGAPWAGAVFGMEMLAVGRLRLIAPLECLIASFVGSWTCLVLGAPHTHYPQVIPPEFSFATSVWVLAAGIAFGLAARGFVALTHGVEAALHRLVRVPLLTPFVGGVLVLGLTLLEGRGRYAGLGIPVIQEALREPADPRAPFWKAAFTALTLGSGFKGGEFIPLVFIGATLGSALSLWLPLPVPLLAALGCAAIFGAAANTPLACAIMAMEIFGPGIGPYALLAGFAAYAVSGDHGIYRAQRVHRSKLAPRY